MLTEIAMTSSQGSLTPPPTFRCTAAGNDAFSVTVHFPEGRSRTMTFISFCEIFHVPHVGMGRLACAGTGGHGIPVKGLRDRPDAVMVHDQVRKTNFISKIWTVVASSDVTSREAGNADRPPSAAERDAMLLFAAMIGARMLREAARDEAWADYCRAGRNRTRKPGRGQVPDDAGRERTVYFVNHCPYASTSIIGTVPLN